MTNPLTYLPFDPTAENPGNKINREAHTPSQPGQNFYIPAQCGYYTESLEVWVVEHGVERKLNVQDVECTEHLETVSHLTNHQACCALVLKSTSVEVEHVVISYQAVGGEGGVAAELIQEIMNSLARVGSLNWNDLDHPKTFRPKLSHTHRLAHFYGFEKIARVVRAMTDLVHYRDEAQEITILQRAMRERLSVLSRDVTQQSQTLYNDVLRTCKLAGDQRIAVNDTYIENNSDSETLFAMLLETGTRAGDYIRRYKSRKYAVAILQMMKSQHAQRGTLMLAPQYIDGLKIWLDFQNPTLRLTDNNKKGVQDAVTRQKWYLEQGDFLNATSGGVAMRHATKLVPEPGINPSLGQTFSLVIIYRLPSETASGQYVAWQGNRTQVCVLPTPSVGLSIQSETNQTHLRVLQSNQTEDILHMVVVSYSELTGQTFAELTAPQSNEAFVRNVIEESKWPGDELRYMGGGDHQQADVLHQLVFDRQISEYEVDVLATYFNLRCQAKINLLANGRFDMGLCDFSTGYRAMAPSENNPPEPGDIWWLIKRSTTSNRALSLGLFAIASGLEQASPGDARLVVHATANPVNFWQKNMPVSRGKSYALYVTIYKVSEMPVLVLKVNGVAVQAPTVTHHSGTRMTLCYVFKAPDNLIIMGLTQTKTPTMPMVFLIEQLSLVRDPLLLS